MLLLLLLFLLLNSGLCLYRVAVLDLIFFIFATFQQWYGLFFDLGTVGHADPAAESTTANNPDTQIPDPVLAPGSSSETTEPR